MSDVVRFALLGLGLGAVYGLAAQALVLIHRGSGILNLANGAMAAVGAYVYAETTANGVGRFLGLVLGVLASAALGVIMQLVVLQPLRKASPLTRLVATLGVLTVVRAAMVGWPMNYGDRPQYIAGVLPEGTFEPLHGVTIGVDRAWLLGIGAVITMALWATFKFTRFGLMTRATAENEEATAALGHSPLFISTTNWAAGGALAGLAGILVVPIIGLAVNPMLLLLVPSLAAALVGGFNSFPLTFAGGLAIGVVESELSSGASWIPPLLRNPGWSKSVPFVVIVIILVLRGRALPVRSQILDRLPRVGDGHIHPIPLAIVVALLIMQLNHVVSIFGYDGFSADWNTAFTTTTIVAIISLSLVVVTGYAGQLSLAQYTLAGVAAYVAARASAGGELLDTFSLGTLRFEVAMVVGVAFAIPIGLLVALPALRVRGVNLAVATLAFALVIERVVLGNSDFTGGFGGTVVQPPSVFGVNLNPLHHPGRYATFCLLMFVLAAVAVANLRRGRAGRRLIAVRDNERAAASLGIDVVGAKLYAFGLSAAIAGLGGVLMAFRNPTALFAEFNVANSIQVVVLTVLGGIGLVGGALIAGALSAGGVVAFFADNALGISDTTMLLISGLLLLLNLAMYPDGIAAQIAMIVHGPFGWLRRRKGVPREREPAASAPVEVERAAPAVLSAQDVTVRFGGVTALEGASLVVRPGEVLGLIGPNGAGKTTLIDVLTGFTRADAGSVRLDGSDIGRWSACRRANAGIARSFQSLELFEDMTIRDNLRCASDSRDLRAYVTDLVWPGNPPLSAAARAAIQEFRLDGLLDQRPGDLSFGQRRLVGIARAVASRPSVLLLDEPAAGLDEHESAELGHLVRRLADHWGLAVLLVEHDVALVLATCDRVVAMDFGQVIAEGTPEEVRTDGAVVTSYLGTPVTVG